jgi:hypothetical protein
MKNKIIIGLIIFSIILIGVMIFLFIFHNNNENKIITQNKILLENIEKELVEREKKIKELNDNPVIITKEIIKKMDSSEMKHAILDLQDENIKLYEIIKQDTFMIESLRKNLQKTNNILSESFNPKHGISLFCLAGIDRTIDIDIYLGLSYRHYFFNGRFFISGGLAGKFYKEFGISVLAEIGFNI